MSIRQDIFNILDEKLHNNEQGIVDCILDFANHECFDCGCTTYNSKMCYLNKPEEEKRSIALCLRCYNRYSKCEYDNCPTLCNGFNSEKCKKCGIMCCIRKHCMKITYNFQLQEYCLNCAKDIVNNAIEINDKKLNK